MIPGVVASSVHISGGGPSSPPAYRSQFKGAGGTTGTQTLTEPSGAAANDILIAVIYLEANNTITPPSGWSNSFNGTTMGQFCSDQGMKAELFWIRRGGSAPALTWTYSSVYSQGCIVAYSGAKTSGDPFSFGTESIRNDQTLATWPAVSGTTLDNNEMLIWIGLNYNGGFGSIQPTGFTERAEITSDDIAFADLVQASAGSTGSVSGASWSGTGNGNASSQLVGLRPV